MAKVDKKHFEIDEAYINGMEHMYNIIKSILELPSDKRQERFGAVLIANIMDKFDFQQIREIMVERLEKRYIIRGIKVNEYNQKRVVAESGQLKFPPDEEMVSAFMDCHEDVMFATVAEIYVKVKG